MFQLINNFIIQNANVFATALVALLLIIIGTPLISFKGGIPRVAGKIINKGKGIIFAGVVAIVILFVISPLLTLLLIWLMGRFSDYVIPILILFLGLTILEWNKKMRWDYKWYGIPWVVIGIILLLLEIFLY